MPVISPWEKMLSGQYDWLDPNNVNGQNEVPSPMWVPPYSQSAQMPSPFEQMMSGQYNYLDPNNIGPTQASISPKPSISQEPVKQAEYPSSSYPSASRATSLRSGGERFAPVNENEIPGLAEEKDIINRLKAYRDKMPTEAAGKDLGFLMAAADLWGNNGKQFLSGLYKRPETAAERQAAIAGVNKGIGDIANKLSDDEIKLRLAKLKGEENQMIKSAINQRKDEADREKDLEALNKALDTEKSSGRFTPVGKAQLNLQNAERMQGLLDLYGKNANEMPLEGFGSVSELAIGLNAMLSSTGGSEESRKSLIPSTATGKYSTVQQFLSGKPTGAQLGEFINKAQELLDRERLINAKQITGYKDKIKNVYGLGRLAKHDPETFDRVVNIHLGDAALQPRQEAGGIDLETKALLDEKARRNAAKGMRQ